MGKTNFRSQHHLSQSWLGSAGSPKSTAQQNTMKGSVRRLSIKAFDGRSHVTLLDLGMNCSKSSAFITNASIYKNYFQFQNHCHTQKSFPKIFQLQIAEWRISNECHSQAKTPTQIHTVWLTTSCKRNRSDVPDLRHRHDCEDNGACERP